MKGFLAAAEARALAMREEMLVTTRGNRLPKEKMEKLRDWERAPNLTEERVSRARKCVALKSQGFNARETSVVLSLSEKTVYAALRYAQRNGIE